MDVYSTRTLMDSPTVEVSVEWDEWEGAPTDEYIKAFAAGAAARHAYDSVAGAAIKAYTTYGNHPIPEGQDTTGATGAIVWVSVPAYN